MSKRPDKKKGKMQFKRVAEALRHPYRAKILHQLHTGPSTASTLHSKVGTTRQNVLHHMKALSRENLVQQAPKPAWVSDKAIGFKLTPGGEDIAEFIDATFEFANGNNTEKTTWEDDE